MSAQSIQSPILVKRLNNDAKALMKEPVVDATAHPSDTDITVWHGAINIKLEGMAPAPLHFLIHFPKDYPLAAPSVGFSTNWNYTDGAAYTVSSGPMNGKYAICLNILGNFAHVHTEWAAKKGEGWSPAFSISTLLINLQSVLLDKITSSSKAEMQAIHEEIMKYKSKNYVPEISEKQGGAKPSATAESKAPVNPFDSVFASVPTAPTDMKDKCMSFLSSLKEEEKKKEFLSIIEAMTRLNISGATGAVVAPKPPAPPPIDESIFCWFSQANYTEDVLGYGIAVEQKHEKAKKTIFTDGDFISLAAYKPPSNLRTFPNKDSFQFFLPVWINERHASQDKKWRDALEESILAIGKYLGCTTRVSSILTIFPDLINTMIVKMMDSQSDINASLKIFECIVNLWRVFSYLVRATPEVLKSAIDSTQAFINNDNSRRKGITPNLGWTLAIVSALSSEEVDFGKFIKAYEEESFLRKIFWWKKDRVVLDADPTFIASEISRNISLFQFTFITQVIGHNTTSLTAEMEATNCKLPAKLESFLTKWKEVTARLKTTPNWNQFFAELVAMGYPEASKEEIVGTREKFVKYLQTQCAKAETLEGYVPSAGGGGGGAGRGGWGGRGNHHNHQHAPAGQQGGGAFVRAMEGGNGGGRGGAPGAGGRGVYRPPHR